MRAFSRGNRPANYLAAALTALAALAAPGAQAGTVAAVSQTALADNSVGSATSGVGRAGYIFWGDTPASSEGSGGSNVGATLNNLPSWASVSTAGDLYFGGGTSFHTFSTLTVAGTAYVTGVVYQTNVSSAVLATITLGANAPQNFILSLLTANADIGQQVGAAVSLDGTSGATVQPAGLSSVSDTNDFLKFAVAGAQAGDTLTITELDLPGTVSRLGGIAFDPVPEPASAALVEVGAAALFGLRRLHTARRRG